jgi:hypothetical protein
MAGAPAHTAFRIRRDAAEGERRNRSGTGRSRQSRRAESVERREALLRSKGRLKSRRLVGLRRAVNRSQAQPRSCCVTDRPGAGTRTGGRSADLFPYSARCNTCRIVRPPERYICRMHAHIFWGPAPCTSSRSSLCLQRPLAKRISWAMGPDGLKTGTRTPNCHQT